MSSSKGNDQIDLRVTTDSPSLSNVVSFTKKSNQSFERARNAASGLQTDDFEYLDTFKEFNSSIEELGNRSVKVFPRLIEAAQSSRRTSSDVKPSLFNSLDSVTTGFADIYNVIDNIFEEVDNQIDKEEGKNAATRSGLPAGVTTSFSRPYREKGTEYRVFYTTNVPRPQDGFLDSIDNSSKPHTCKLITKPNAIVPLEKSFECGVEPGSENANCPPPLESAENKRNPYFVEIESAAFALPQWVLTPFESLPLPPRPPDLSAHELIWIDNADTLKLLLDELKRVKMFGIDLEQHAYRSYQGFSCLVAITFESKDVLIDVLVPEVRRDMYLLNEVFTDPNIVKIVHGSDFDVLWFQRDFGIFFVNIFDTAQAARILNFASYSLSHLLSKYCQCPETNENKTYQLADWRIRPIPVEMIQYARTDSHYLPYLFKILVRELYSSYAGEGSASLEEMKFFTTPSVPDLTKGRLIRLVFEKSSILTKSVYEKPSSLLGSLRMFKKVISHFTPSQHVALLGLLDWRDRTARAEDESPRYVCPNHIVLKITTALPTTSEALFTACGSTKSVPPLVRRDVAELVHMNKTIAAKKDNAEIPPELKSAFDSLIASSSSTSPSSSSPPDSAPCSPRSKEAVRKSAAGASSLAHSGSEIDKTSSSATTTSPEPSDDSKTESSLPASPPSSSPSSSSSKSKSERSFYRQTLFEAFGWVDDSRVENYSSTTASSSTTSQTATPSAGPTATDAAHGSNHDDRLAKQFQQEIVASMEAGESESKAESVGGGKNTRVVVPGANDLLSDDDSDDGDDENDDDMALDPEIAAKKTKLDAVASGIQEWFLSTSANRHPPTHFTAQLLAAASPSPPASPTSPTFEPPSASSKTTNTSTSKRISDSSSLSGVSTPPEIPHSVQEIYRLSNANRKRNKMKKSMGGSGCGGGEDDGTGTGELPLPQDPQPTRVSGPRGEDDTLEYLSSIGWGGSSDIGSISSVSNEDSSESLGVENESSSAAAAAGNTKPSRGSGGGRSRGSGSGSGNGRGGGNGKSNLSNFVSVGRRGKTSGGNSSNTSSSSSNAPSRRGHGRSLSLTDSIDTRVSSSSSSSSSGSGARRGGGGYRGRNRS